MNEMEIKKEKYQHYKGGKYEVIGIAKHSETLEEMVVYQSLENNSIWVRPRKMFFEEVEVDKKKVKRFKLLE